MLAGQGLLLQGLSASEGAGMGAQAPLEGCPPPSSQLISEPHHFWPDRPEVSAWGWGRPRNQGPQASVPKPVRSGALRNN